MNVQTDLTLSDISNFEVYKDWYVNESWTAFSQFAKFRKDILKEVKDEYITKNKAFKKKNEYKKKKKAMAKDSWMTPNKYKRKKIEDNWEVGFNTIDDNYNEAFLRNSLQKTWEIIIKTDRVGAKVKRLKQHSFSDSLQEFSCQAYMHDPCPKASISCGISDGFQTDLKVDYHDRNIQAITCETAVTSTQTRSDCSSGLDVCMQFPASNEQSEVPEMTLWKEFSVEWDLLGESKSFKDVCI